MALLALLAAWVWSRRAGTSNHRNDSVSPVAADFEATPVDAETPDYASHQPAPPLPPRTRPGSTHDARFSGSGSHMADKLADKLDEFDREAVATNTPSYTASEALAAVHHPVDAPVIFDDTPDSFEVDSRPVTTVDFLVGMDEKLPEDRVRRLQYMHERYPELKSNTVSIDDADSVINAARMYYEEADKGNGRDKACELLTFAVEERPQEIRFWLAQFEIFRLENMPAEFTAMAGKFHVLFSHTSAWPMVRHIGHELDPGNPLFAAGGSPLLAGETRFDPIAENWLNAPMDFTSDALMSDLRLALLDDYGVSRADFESITARLSTEGTT